jgi:hypothetical protein
LNSPQVIACYPERLGDPVGGAKADAADLFGDDVRIVSHDSRSVRAVLADNFACGRWPHPERVEKAHRLGFDPTLANGLGDRFRPLLPDAGYLAQSRRLGRDDVEGLRTEAFHEPGRQSRADARDQP